MQNHTKTYTYIYTYTHTCRYVHAYINTYTYIHIHSHMRITNYPNLSTNGLHWYNWVSTNRETILLSDTFKRVSKLFPTLPIATLAVAMRLADWASLTLTVIPSMCLGTLNRLRKILLYATRKTLKDDTLYELHKWLQ